MSTTQAAKKPKMTRQNLFAEQKDLGRKIQRKIADMKAGRTTWEHFITQTGSIFSEFFRRVENCFSDEVLREVLPEAFPFEDLRTEFQNRLNELSGENRDGMIAEEAFKEALVDITEEFLDKLTDAEE